MPNYEYEPKVDAGFIPNARMKIMSVQFDASEGDESLFVMFVQTLDAETGVETVIKETNAEKYEMNSECVLSNENGRISVRYKESAEGLPEWETSISFDASDRGIVSIIRSGQLSHSFVIEQGVRHFSVYKTPYGPLEMCVRGKKVVNELDENGGRLILDYAVELKGMTAQRTRMTVEVKKN